MIADGTVLAGHARLQCALQMAADGLAIPRNPDPWSAPTVDLSHFSKQQRAAYVMADNQSATLAGWSQDIMAEELGWLNEDGFDLSLTAFSEGELADLLGGIAPGEGVDPDGIPETPLHPVTQPGDCWLLGRHRIVCGDSTSAESVKLALNGVKPHLMVTDPPTGVEYDPGDRGRARNASGKSLSTGGRRAMTQEVTRSDWREAMDLFPGDVAYVWHSALNPAAAQKMLEDSGFEIRMQIIWAKSGFVVSRGHYHVQHHPCFYSVRKNRTAHWKGDRKQSTLWQIDKQAKNASGISSEKPVECMLRPIENNSSEGQAVYDPFLGSGSGLIAAHMSDRVMIGLDIEPRCIDVCIKRYQQLAQADAYLESTGKTFDEMALERPYGEVAA